MACLFTGGRTTGCNTTDFGGIRRVYLANFQYVSNLTASAGVVTDLDTVNALGVSAPAFYKFDFRRNTASVTETGTAIATTGAVPYVPQITMVFGGRLSADAESIKIMGQAKMVAIVEDANGKFVIYGALPTIVSGTASGNGLDMTSATYASGTNMTDASAWTIVLTGGENAPGLEVPANIMTSAILV